MDRVSSIAVGLLVALFYDDRCFFFVLLLFVSCNVISCLALHKATVYRLSSSAWSFQGELELQSRNGPFILPIKGYLLFLLEIFAWS